MTPYPSFCYCANFYCSVRCTNTVSKFGERCLLCTVARCGVSLTRGMLPEESLWLVFNTEDDEDWDNSRDSNNNNRQGVRLDSDQPSHSASSNSDSDSSSNKSSSSRSWRATWPFRGAFSLPSLSPSRKPPQDGPGVCRNGPRGSRAW